eukprot:SAG31_NODE_3371_length_4353_cov_3.023507_1_plen_67_part_00
MAMGHVMHAVPALTLYLTYTTVPVKLLALILNLARYCTGLRWYLGLVLQPISCWYREVPNLYFAFR